MKRKTYKKNRKIYALVVVESGIPVSVKLFDNLLAAKEKESSIQEKINHENDETAIFKLAL